MNIITVIFFSFKKYEMMWKRGRDDLAPRKRSFFEYFFSNERERERFHMTIEYKDVIVRTLIRLKNVLANMFLYTQNILNL